MEWSGGVYARSCASRKSVPVPGPVTMTIDAGPMPSSQLPGCSRYTRLGSVRDSPDEDPPTGEPYAGKPPVRFAGRGRDSHPDPYPGWGGPGWGCQSHDLSS